MRRHVLPWQSTSPYREQMRFIAAWEEEAVSFGELCRGFGISRKTGYRRVARFREGGWAGLGDRSRAPHRHPNQVAAEVAEMVVAARRAHPTWGARKLVPWLAAQDPQRVWPAPSTVAQLLRRVGLVHPRRRSRRTAPWGQSAAWAQVPNDVWTVDFKGWFRTGDGQRCDPLTVVDRASRYLLVCEALEHPKGPQVQRVMERAFEEFGLPAVLRSDNGTPFASPGLGGLSRLSVWWVKLGVLPERIRPGHPEQNGSHERLHRTLKQETARPPHPSLGEQQAAFDAFRTLYNQERPHEALGQRTPASQYRPSPRSYPSRVPTVTYPSSHVVRRVRVKGEIKWRGATVYLSEALRGEPVGLHQEDDRFWSISFGPLKIGLLDDHQRTVIRVPVEVSPMCLD